MAQNHPSFNMTSPPGHNLMPSSPLNPQPSPMTAHSPGPNLYHMRQSDDVLTSVVHPDSSPFAAAMSPG